MKLTIVKLAMHILSLALLAMTGVTAVGLDLLGAAAGNLVGRTRRLPAIFSSLRGKEESADPYSNGSTLASKKELSKTIDINLLYGAAGNPAAHRNRRLVEDPWAQIGSDILGDDNGDLSGSAVSMSADGARVVIGARHNGSGAGYVRIFDRATLVWNQVGADIEGDVTNDNAGYSVVMSANGRRVAIGAPFKSGNSGHVRVFEWVAPKWIQVGEDIDGEEGGDVAMSEDGNRVVIGVLHNSGNGTKPNSGHIQVFDWVAPADATPPAWNQVGEDIDAENTDDIFGYSVAMSATGRRIAIGAPFHNSNGTNSGQVKIFDWVAEAWLQVGENIDGEAGDQFGSSVAMSGDGGRVAICARNHVQAFDWVVPSTMPAWTQVGLNIDGENPAVAMSEDGSRIAVGAIWNDGVNDSSSGHVQIFDWVSRAWAQTGGDIDEEETGNRSGRSIGMSADGKRVASGTPVHGAGRVSVYEAPVCIHVVLLQ